MRKSKISADITLEAHNMLRDYCIKHERSKGFLLEKMIRKFCGEVDAGGEPPVKTEQQIAVDNYVKPKAPVKRFVPPTVEEVREYCDSRCNNVDPQNFVDHYTGNGWIRGKTKVKCWKACVRTWENKSKPEFSASQEESLKGNW